jgi:acylphosphatase
MILARVIKMSGNVQGVSFRDSMVREALRVGLVGWVRNLSDGSVEAFAQGEPVAMEDILQWARLGPPGCRVDDLSSETATVDPSLKTFERRKDG